MGQFIEIVKKPDWTSVEEYKKYLKNNAPNIQLGRDLQQSEVECTCCGQGAPSEVSALIKCEDHTPVTMDLAGQKGEQLWICADCFHYGVRPKFVKYGNIHWNAEGRRVQNRDNPADWEHW